MVREKLNKVQADLQEGKKIEGQRTIFHDLFANNQLQPEEKTAERLEAEGVGLVAAGYLYPLAEEYEEADRCQCPRSMTVALTLSVISYHVIANPPILQKLQKELGEALPKMAPQPQWTQLEQLPYLVNFSTPSSMVQLLTLRRAL